MTLGEKIKELRRKNDLTQEKLADYLRVSYQAVSKWETGLNCPDISLIVPLANLFNITTDELLGMQSGKDSRYEELKAMYDATFKTGNLKERCRIANMAVSEYPGDMEYLEWLAWAEGCHSFEFKDNETYAAEQEKAISHFAVVIENCTDEKIRNGAIEGIVQYLSFRGRKDEAKKYAVLYPDTAPRKNVVLGYCLDGEEKAKHQQKTLNEQLYDICNQLFSISGIEALKAIETIIKTLIPDGNYIEFHHSLYRVKLASAQALTSEGKLDKAVDELKQAFHHAKEFDRIHSLINDKLKYTAPLFNLLEEDTSKWMRTGTGFIIDDLKESLSFPWAKSLSDRKDVKNLFA